MPESSGNPAKTARAGKSSKRDKFVQLAEKRTKNAYDYTEADVNKIAKALNREVDLMKARMSATGAKESVDFSL